MRLSDIAMYRAIQAGINDPHIFKAIFLAGGPGSGKCLGENVPVMLHEGVAIRAKDVRVGDKLMGDDGTPRNVVRVSHEQGPMVCIIPVKGDNFECGENHILVIDIPHHTKESGIGQSPEYETIEMDIQQYLDMSNSFKDKAKLIRTNNEFKSVRHTGFTVEKIGKGTYCSIETDGNHRHLLGDFTITHNSFIARQMFSGQGLKFLNSDAAFEFLLKQRGLSFDIDPDNEEEYAQQMKARGRAKHLAAMQKVGWINGMLGLVLDGTGKDFAKIKAAREGLEAIGYDTGMVFVNTSKEVAIQRNQERQRSVPEEVVLKGWKAVQDNMGKFQTLFGTQNFFIVDNSEKLDAAGIRDLSTQLHRTAMKWLAKPLKNPVGQMTAKVLRETGGKTMADLPQAVEEISKAASIRYATFIDHHLAEMDRAAAKTCVNGSCQACKGCLAKSEQWVCGKCRAEIKGYLGEDYIDPNGPSWFAKVMRRLPLVRFSPYSW